MIIKKYVYLMLGAVLCGVGVGIAVSTGLGADPITVFFEGLKHTFNISVGTASLITMLMCALIAWLFNPKLIGLGTLITPIGVQFGIDSTIKVMPTITQAPYTYLVWAIGIVVLGFGIALALAAHVANQGSDALILALAEKTGLSYTQVRWGTDAMFVVGGLLLGGSLHWICLLAVLTLGTIVSFFQTPLEKWIHTENVE